MFDEDREEDPREETPERDACSRQPEAEETRRRGGAR